MQYGPIQSFPSGLLALLGIKNNGLYPSLLNDSYQATLDALKWLMAGQALETGRAEDFAGRPLGNQNWAANTLSNGTDWWYVESYSVYGNMASAATSILGIQCSWLSNTPNGRAFLIGDPSDIQTSTAAGRRVTCRAEGFFMPPQSELAVMLLANETATTQNLVAHVRYVPLRA